MVRIGACTVIYNPDEQVINNIKTYFDKVNVCVVVDNSEKKNIVCELLKNTPKITYIDMHGNKGIAAALNRGIEFLQKKDIDYVLTMDQDSKFPKQYYEKIINLVEKYGNEYSVVGLNYNYSSKELNDEIVEAQYWLTSGNFVKITDFNKIGKFDEELFIDYVDIEYGYKLYKNNLKLCYLKNFSLEHEIGNPIQINLFGKKFFAMNHNAIRYYYRYRNSYYLYKKDKIFFKKEFFKEIFVNIPKMMIYERDRRNKIKMIYFALKDAKSKKMGKYDK